jgi:hypothetical protein
MDKKVPWPLRLKAYERRLEEAGALATAIEQEDYTFIVRQQALPLVSNRTYSPSKKKQYMGYKRAPQFKTTRTIFEAFRLEFPSYDTSINIDGSKDSPRGGHSKILDDLHLVVYHVSGDLAVTAERFRSIIEGKGSVVAVDVNEHGDLQRFVEQKTPSSRTHVYKNQQDMWKVISEINRYGRPASARLLRVCGDSWEVVVRREDRPDYELGGEVLRQAVVRLSKALPLKGDVGGNRSIKGVPRREEKARSQKDEGYHLFPEQKNIAEKLFSTLQQVMQDNKVQLSDFSKVKFLIWVPKFNSLEKQTNDRVEQWMEAEGIPVECALTLTREHTTPGVFKGVRSEAADAFIWRLGQVVEEDPNTLYLFIHDECHYGVGEDGIMDRYMSETTAQRNVYCVAVSATFYNILAGGGEKDSLDPARQVVFWSDEETAASYTGLARLRADGKIVSPKVDISDGLYENCMKAMALDVTLNALDPEWIAPLVEYVQGLQDWCAEREPKSVTAEFLHSMMDESQLVAVRFSKRKPRALIGGADLFERVLEEMVQHRQLPLKLVGPSNSEYALKDLQSLRREPTLVVLVDKLRMGDTLPDFFSMFDLRLRYDGLKCMWSTIFQDVGRTFGYRPKAPTLLVNDACLATLEDSFQTVVKHVDRYVKRAPMQEEGREDVNMHNEGLLQVISEEFVGKRTLTAANTSMYLDLDLSHHVLLAAKPQCGKTGAFLHLIKLVVEAVERQTTRL